MVCQSDVPEGCIEFMVLPEAVVAVKIGYLCGFDHMGTVEVEAVEVTCEVVDIDGVVCLAERIKFCLLREQQEGQCKQEGSGKQSLQHMIR